MKSLTLFFFYGILFTSLTIALPLYKKTDHFIIFCETVDQAAAEELLEEANIFYNNLMSYFKHLPDKKITIEIYPNIQLLHKAINWATAPDWIIARDNIDIIQMVSPHNPGTYHTSDSVMRSHKVGLAAAFIYNKYQHHDLIPYWLHQGVALYKAEFFSKNVSEKLALNISSLPKLQQLEAISKDNTIAFDKLDGFHVSYSLVQFINHQWGWQSILDLLEDYSQFEEILTIDKESFIHLWKKYIISFL